MAAPKSRPMTCGELFATMPDLADKGCKRLPRHHGDHRPALKLSAARKLAVKSAPRGGTAPRVTRSIKARTAKAKAAPVYTIAMALADPTSAASKLARVTPRSRTAKAAVRHSTIAGTTAASKRRSARSAIAAMVESGRVTATEALALVSALR